MARNPAVANLAHMTGRVHEEIFDMPLDTKRGLVTFQAHLFYNNHLRFILLTQRAILGRRIRALNELAPGA